MYCAAKNASTKLMPCIFNLPLPAAINPAKIDILSSILPQYLHNKPQTEFHPSTTRKRVKKKQRIVRKPQNPRLWEQVVIANSPISPPFYPRKVEKRTTGMHDRPDSSEYEKK